MSSKTLTIWQLDNEQKIEQFYQETIEYMIISLPYVNFFKGHIHGSCGYNHFSHEYEEEVVNPMERFEKFCESKGFDPRESREILINLTDEYYTCDCNFLIDIEPTPRLEELVNKYHPE